MTKIIPEQADSYIQNKFFKQKKDMNDFTNQKHLQSKYQTRQKHDFLNFSPFTSLSGT